MDDQEFLENNILASFITDFESHRYIKDLAEENFATKNRKIFKAIKELYNSKEDINLITVNNKLSSGSMKHNYLKELTKMTDDLITTANIKDSIEKLKDIYLRKDMFNILTTSISKLKDVEKDPLDVRKDIMKSLSQLKDNRLLKTSEDMKDVLMKTFAQIEEKFNKGEDYSLYSGFFELDKLTDGFHESELSCIGARPGTGKTAFALNLAVNIAARKNAKKVYFCTLEMSSEQIMQRILANFSSVNGQFIRTGRINKNEMVKIASKTEKISKLNLKIDTKSRYIEDIENIAISLKDKEQIDVLIIDYLTLLKSKEKFSIRELEVAEISRRLKLLALDLKIPIIILAQLNRDAENKVPTMANIRESGSIEQNCDNIIFLHNPSDEKKNVEIIDVILEKQRQGSTGKLQLIFDKKYSRFSNIER